MSATQRMDVDGIQSVSTTIEKIELDEGRELQWLIRNFDAIHSSSLRQITQDFGPLNGKVLIKLDLTKKEGGKYEMGVRVQPANNVMWMSFQFKMCGVESSDFCIVGDPRDIPDNRMAHTLEISAVKDLKFTFKPEILLSVASVVVGTPAEQSSQEPTAPTPNAQQNNTSSSTTPPLFSNTQWADAFPTFLQQTLHQRINECNHWANFFTNYPTELNQLQQHITSILTNSELIRESPRMLQGLLNELQNNPDYSPLNQGIQGLMSGVRQQCENLRNQMQQNQPTTPQQNAEAPSSQENSDNAQQNVETPQQNAEVHQSNLTQDMPTDQNSIPLVEEIVGHEKESFGSFPPLVENAQQLFQQLPAEQQPTHTTETVQTALESANNAYEQYREDFAGLQQQYQDLISFSLPTPSEQVTIPSAPVAEEPNSETLPQENAMETVDSNVVHENKPAEPVRAHSSNSNASSHKTGAAWTYVFATKGITGYVRHVKSLTQRVPYHRNFCTAQNWTLPDGSTIKVELVHALHPDAPFICLFDYDNTIDRFFVQTLLDGNGQEIHKIDSFSNSYQGFTPDMLLQSAEIDDCVRIRIEAIVDLD